MEVWIIQDGEKTGPFHDFEIRRRIEAGELPATTPAWHDGLDAWRPLEEIQIFKSEFDKPFLNSEPPETQLEPEFEPEPLTGPEPKSTLPPPIESKAPVRRFWARWLDLYLYSAFWWLMMWAAGRDIGSVFQNVWIILLQFVPWFVFEAWLIHRFGTTPGKWLLGLKVTNDDGSPLALGESTRRAMRVLFIGVGFGWGVLALVCQAMSFFTMRRVGRPLWDHAGGHRVSAAPLHPLRIVVFVFVFFASLQLQGLVVGPYATEQFQKQFPDLKERLEKQFPTLKEHFDQHPTPRFPDRN